MPEKNQEGSQVETPAEKIAGTMKSTEAKVEKSIEATKENNEALKEMTLSLKSFIEAHSKQSDKSEEVLELKSKLALLEAQMKAKDTGFSGGSAISEEEIKEFTAKSKEFASEFVKAAKQAKSFSTSKIALEIKSDLDFKNLFAKEGSLEIKSLNTFDNTSTGFNYNSPVKTADVDINKKPVSRISPFVNNVTAAENVVYNELDLSYIKTFESKEYQGKTTGDVIKWARKEIKQDQDSVKIPVSDKVLHLNMAGGFDIDPIAKLLSAIEDEYNLKKDKFIVLDYIRTAQKAQTRINKSFTATANTVVIKDILLAISKLKPVYTANGLGSLRFLCDVAVVDEIFTEVGDDGHGMFEYFDYANKLIGLKTSRGVVELVGVESEFFQNYFKFDNNGAATSTEITSGYVAGGSNEGKVVGMFADLNMTYTMVSSPASLLQIDNSFADQLTQGYVWAGKIGYYGGVVKLEEAVSMLIVKNS